MLSATRLPHAHLLLLARLLPLLLAACGDAEAPPHLAPTESSGPSSCPAGQIAGVDGACIAVGIQGCAAQFLGDDGLCHPRIEACPPGQIPKLDEGCVPVGIDACGKEHAGDDGLCHPAMKNCPDGTFAVPSGCLPVDGPDGCGDDPWGAAPGDATTVYVDASFTGTTQDGSKTSPFATLREAVGAAPAGGRVAIAAGTYRERLVIRRPLTLAGRCASKVQIAFVRTTNGDNATVAAVNAGDVTIQGVEINGAGDGLGVAATDASRVTLDHVVVRNAALVGIGAISAPAEIIVSNTWIDQSVQGWAMGGRGIMLVEGAKATLDHVAITRSATAGLVVAGQGTECHVAGTLIEGTLPAPTSEGGSGIIVAQGALAVVEGSALVENAFVGAQANGPGSSIELRGALVERTRENDVPGSGVGVEAVFGAQATLAGSALLDNRMLGLIAFGAGTEATLSASLIRGSAAEASAEPAPAAVPAGGVLASDSARATLVDSAISGCRGNGVASQLAAEVTMTGVLVQGTRPRIGDRNFGAGGPRGHLTLTRSALVDNSDTSLLVTEAGAVLVARESLVEGTAPSGTGEYGVGVGVGGSVHVELTSNVVTWNRYVGVALWTDQSGAPDATMTDNLIANTQGEAATGDLGVGLYAENGTLQLSSLVLRDNQMGGAFLARDEHASLERVLIDGATGGSFTDKSTSTRYDGVGDGLLVMHGAAVDVRGARVTRCARAGILYAGSSGALADVEASGNRFGLVLQGAPQPTLGDAVRLDGNTESDKTEDGDLPIPDQPVPLP